MARIVLLLSFCASACVAASRVGGNLAFKHRIFMEAIDANKQRRDLRSCWLDQTGECCANDISDCQYYRTRSKTRSYWFNFYYMPFYPGNFYYHGCEVQCLCSTSQSPCSIGNPPPPVPSQGVDTTTTTATAATTTNAASTNAASTTTVTTTTATTATSVTTTFATTTSTTTTSATTISATTSFVSITDATTTTVITTPTATTVSTTDSTTATTTTATTTIATTTAPPTVTRTRYCPDGVSTQPDVVRLLGGQALTNCDEYPGVVTVVNKKTNTVMCSGLVTSSNSVSIPNNCAANLTETVELRQPPINDGMRFEIIQEYGPLTDKQRKALPVGGPYEIHLKKPLTPTSCPGIACLFDTRMAHSIDLTQCKVVASGYDTKLATPGVMTSHSFIDVTTLQPTDTCRSHLTKGNLQGQLINQKNYSYNCFFAHGQSTCAGDIGGSVMCPLSTKEIVVVGQIENYPCEGTGVVGFYSIDEVSLRVAKPRLSSINLGLGSQYRKTISLGVGGNRRNSKGGVVLGLKKVSRKSNLVKTNRGINLRLKKGHMKVKLGLSKKEKKLRFGKLRKNRILDLGKGKREIKLVKKNRTVKLGLGKGRGIRLSKAARGIKLVKSHKRKRFILGQNKKIIRLDAEKRGRGIKLEKDTRSIKLGRDRTHSKKNGRRGIKLTANKKENSVKLGVNKNVKKQQNRLIKIRNRGVQLG